MIWDADFSGIEELSAKQYFWPTASFDIQCYDQIRGLLQMKIIHSKARSYLCPFLALLWL